MEDKSLAQRIDRLQKGKQAPDRKMITLQNQTPRRIGVEYYDSRFKDSVVVLALLPLLGVTGTAWADTGSAGPPQASTLVWPLLGVGLVWLSLAVCFKRFLPRRPIGPLSVRLTILGILTLYFATLGPHLGHHITEASAADSHCTVLIVIDSTYTGLAEQEPPPVPAPEPLFALPIPEIPSHLAVSYFAFTYSRAPPVRSV